GTLCCRYNDTKRRSVLASVTCGRTYPSRRSESLLCDPLCPLWFKSTAKVVQYLLRLGSLSPIYVHSRVGNHPVGLNNVSSRQRQLPALITVVSGKPRHDGFVHMLHFRCEPPNQAKFPGHFVAGIAQNREAQLVHVPRHIRMLLRLWRDGHKRCASIGYLGMNSLKRCKLSVAVSAPASTIEDDHQRPLSQEVL